MAEKQRRNNPINKKDDKCLQYAITVALNNQNINNHPELISKIRLLIDQCNWNGIAFPSHQKD